MFPKLAVEAVLGQEVPHGAEELQAVIAGVRHQDLVLGVTGNVPGIKELPVAGALLAELQDEISWRKEMIEDRGVKGDCICTDPPE